MPDILGRVVLVDMEIALGLQRDVDQGVAGQLLDHMVEEADPGRDLVGAGPVEIDGGRDRGLLGPARDGRCPRLGVFAPLLHVGQSSAKALSNSLLWGFADLIRPVAKECYSGRPGTE